MAKKQLLEGMCLEPTRFFRAPGDVLRDRRFSDSERYEILLAWERLATAADNEDHKAAILRAVHAAREEAGRRLAAAAIHSGDAAMN